jgi:hypothetical protein
MVYRQAEFSSAQQMQAELERLAESEDFPELVGFDHTETPFIAFAQEVLGEDHRFWVILLNTEDGVRHELKQKPLDDVAYPVRTLTRPGESAGKR